MGLFDDIRFDYPLPMEGANALNYQTKDLDCYMEHYEVRADGTLWQEDYEVEDRSDPNAEGIMRLSGAMSRVNKRWKRIEWTGEANCYNSFRGDCKDWIEWKVTFVDGKVYRIELVEHRRESPAADSAEILSDGQGR